MSEKLQKTGRDKADELELYLNCSWEGSQVRVDCYLREKWQWTGQVITDVFKQKDKANNTALGFEQRSGRAVQSMRPM